MKAAVLLLVALATTAGMAGCLDPSIKDGALAEYTKCRVFFFLEVSPVKFPCEEVGIQAPATASAPSGFTCVEQHTFDGGSMLVYTGLDPDTLVLGFRFDADVDAVGGLIDVRYDLSGDQQRFRWTADPEGTAFVELGLAEPFTQPFTLDMQHATSLRTEATSPLDEAAIRLSWAVTVEEEDLEPQLVHRFEDAEGGPFFFVTNQPRSFDGSDFALRLQPELIEDSWSGPPMIGPTFAGCTS